MSTPKRTKGINDFTEETAAANDRERKIDQHVYALYGLMPQEAKIMEGDTK